MILDGAHVPFNLAAVLHDLNRIRELAGFCVVVFGTGRDKQAFEMLVTGEFISAQEAKARGLVNRVAEPEQLDAELEELVAAIISKPRVAIAMGKEFFYRQAELGIAAAYDAATQIMACNMMDEAALEGVQAFIEKRPPRWK